MKPDTYSIRQAALYSGLKGAMVDYLCRAGIVLPSGGDVKPGRGKARLYTFGDIVVLKVVAQLLARGISVARLKGALSELRQKHGQITKTSLPGKFLITDGERVYFHNAKGAVSDLNKNSQQVFAFMVELKSVRDSVISSIEETGKPTKMSARARTKRAATKRAKG